MNAPAKAPWLEHRERGTRSATRFMKWLALRCGRRVARLVLYPICAYFLLFSPQARAASRQYLGRALGRPARLGDLWRHYFTFAATVLDRVYFLGGQFDRFDIEIEGLDLVHRTLANGRGCLLIGAHLGSFELLRNLAAEHRMPVSAVMYEDNAGNITDVLSTVNAKITSSTIAPRASLTGAGDPLSVWRRGTDDRPVPGQVPGDRVLDSEGRFDPVGKVPIRPDRQGSIYLILDGEDRRRLARGNRAAGEKYPIHRPAGGGICTRTRGHGIWAHADQGVAADVLRRGV